MLDTDTDFKLSKIRGNNLEGVLFLEQVPCQKAHLWIDMSPASRRSPAALQQTLQTLDVRRDRVRASGLRNAIYIAICFPLK